MRRSIHWSALSLLIAAHAVAQDDPFARGIDVVPFKVTPMLNSGITLEGAEPFTTRGWHLAPMLDFNVGLLNLNLGKTPLGSLLPFRMDLHVMGGVQLHERIDVAADLPITLVQLNGFALLEQQGFPQPAPSVAGLGALRVMGRFNIFRQSALPLGSLSALMEIRVPLGDTSAFLSDRGFVFAPKLTFEHELGPVRIIANGGYQFRTAPGRFLNLYVAHMFMLGLGGILGLGDKGKLRNLQVMLEVNLSTPAEAPFTFRDAEVLKTPLEVFAGARTRIGGSGITLTLGVAKGFGSGGYGRELIRFVLGVGYERDPTSFDSDGDGINDAVDQCPSEKETKNGINDGDGCVDVNTEDTDNDGIPDARDPCPTEPGLEELDGCPDTDGDGVSDKVDLCPKDAGHTFLDGCPDADDDQIPDTVDACPDKLGPPDLNGCPPPEDEAPVVLESEQIRIRNQVLYEIGSDVIDPRSYPLLDEVVKVMQQHQEVGPILIEGHTDNVGPRAYNLDLSQRRAKAVENYLVNKGVARTRLRSEGFGFDRPIAPNDNALNRAKNRRTEFRLLRDEPIEIKK